MQIAFKKYYLLLALLLTVTVVFVIVIFNLSLFKKVFLPNFPTGFYMARAGDSDNLISAVNAGLSCTNGAKKCLWQTPPF